MRKQKCSDLVQDLTFYPRCAVDWSHVETLVEALDSGATMPPIVVCAQSRKVVDGLHRLNAHMRHFGPDAEIECIEKQYATQKEMFLDAVKYNAAHGRPLSRSDRQHCLLSSAKFGCDGEDVAAALQVNVKALGALRTVGMSGPVRGAAASAPVPAPVIDDPAPPPATSGTSVAQQDRRQEWMRGARAGGKVAGERSKSGAGQDVIDAAVFWFSASTDEQMDEGIRRLGEAVAVYVEIIEQRGAA